MRKLLPLISAVLLLAPALRAQVATSRPPDPWLEPASGRLPVLTSPLRNIPNTQSWQPLLPLGVACTGSDLLSSSSNMFTIGLTESAAIAVNNDLNTLIFIHRNNAALLGGNSGQLRYDISTNNGASWTINQGVLNPLATQLGRYPNVAIHNPAGNTDPNNAFLAYLAPTVVGAAWTSHVSGVRQLNGAGNTENYNPASVTQTLIPRGMCKGAPGTFWATELIYTGTAYTGIRVLKGVWNGSTDVTWSQNTSFTTGFNTAYNGALQFADLSIAFDPTGMHGFVGALTHTTPGPTPYSFYPNLWETTDGGVTWTGPHQVDLSQFSCLSTYITAGNQYSTGFDMDLAVDVYGNPHFFTTLCNGNNAYAVFFASAHRMIDVTREHGIWNVYDIADVTRGRGTFGTSPNQLFMDMEPQISRTDDGTKIFFAWSGSDAGALGTANQTPNLFGKAYDVVNKEWTAQRDLSSCNATTINKIYFPKMAETMLEPTAGIWEMPVIYGEFTVGTDPVAVSNFRYLDSLSWDGADFVNAQCNTPVAVNEGDTLVVCQGQSAVLSITGSYNTIRWNNGTSNDSLTVSTGGTYYVAARSGCCIGFDSIVVVIDSAPVANFSSLSNLLTVDFTDGSTVDATTWLWDFGDGAFDNVQNPTHTYATPGTYLVCLIASDSCNSDTICQSVTVTCPAPLSGFSFTSSFYTFNFTDTSAGSGTLTWAWDFGDGNTSTAQNPQHTYAGIGTYTVCLITTDLCGADTVCQQVTATCPAPTASFTWNTVELTGTFINTSTGGTPSWNFGDGNTSNTSSPTHTWGAPGTYVVCLTVTDTCGSTTTCDTLSVDCPAPAAFFTSSSTNGNASFTNGTNPPADGYTWDFGDGGTSTATNPTHTYTTSGTYNVCLMSMDTCGADTFCTNITITIVGVDEPSWAGNLSVFPNPSEQGFEISASLPGGKTLNLSLVNALGQQVWSMENASGQGQTSVPGERLAPGVYLLRAESAGEWKTFRLIRK